MAEEPQSVFQLPPSSAAGGEGLTEVSPEITTPEPPSSAAVSPGIEEPAGDTKKKSNSEVYFRAERREVQIASD
ncbi:ubiquitin-like protein ATG12 [Cebus imitator]|uniref:ubiquitin-like protein ATG12 n=1 Tax=Cebus imitator TaxID=2715852 RepID=UPI00080A33AA|nr:ubiquitin-like protein ATG12 [Cebus imitator]